MDVVFVAFPWLLGSGNPCLNDGILALAEAAL
jgi:hypothetical protein